MKRLIATALLSAGIGAAGMKSVDVVTTAGSSDSSYSMDLGGYIPYVPDSLCSEVIQAHSDNIVHQYSLSEYRRAPQIGDVNWDGRVNNSDIVCLATYLYKQGTLPTKPAN